MAAYMIFEIEITDHDTWNEYRRLAGPLMAASRGRVLVSDDSTQPLEGGWRPPSISVVEFPDIETARAFYESDAYRNTIPLRLRASNGRGILADGVSVQGEG